MTDGLVQGIIDALPEPAFLLNARGGILAANRPARGLLGANAVSGHLGDWLVTSPEDLSRFLERARMTSSPLPGALVFRTRDGETRLRAHCARVSGAAAEVALMLRCVDPRGDRFSMLAERVHQLDEELRRRVREKAVLGEALNENRTLMRELQHRVKNNIQMMMSILSMSAPSAASEEVRRFVGAAKERFRALATAQDLIYEAQWEAEVPARELFVRLAKAIEESTDGGVSIVTDVAEVWLPQDSAHCLALIANELINNSIKHGMDSGTGTVWLKLRRSDGQVRLVIRDSGSGYPDLNALPRTSGLTLIRGLCRQIGASLELGNDGGAKSVVSFGGSHRTATDSGRKADMPAAERTG